jgi:hypothetical protein
MDGEESMAADRKELDPATVQGVRQLKGIFRALERLAPVGCERDHAGNRQLLFHQYAGLVLLGLFNPTLQTVGGLSQLSELRKVQKLLGGPRVSVGSFSEAARVFDSEALRQIFEELYESLPAPSRTISGGTIPDELLHKLTVADGSALRALPKLVAAAAQGKWRVHLEFEVLRSRPERMLLTPDEVGGAADERSVLAQGLRRGRMYVLDRGYERYALLDQIVQAGSDYLVRVQQRPLSVLKELPLSEEDREAGVLQDELVQPGRSRPEVGSITHAVRRLVLSIPEQGRRRTDRPSSENIVLLTNLADVPAEVLAAIYRLRWSIELFFRFLKHVLGCRHLLSHKSEGVAIQVYCALIAALLMSHLTGQSVGKRGFELVCLYLSGWAEEDELAAGIERLVRRKTKG